MKNSTLVCFAVKEEALEFGRATQQRADVVTLITGMGRRNAERAIRESLGKHRPALVLSCGFAGGLDRQLASGAVIFSCDGEIVLQNKLLQAGARPVRFHCAERVAPTAAEKAKLREKAGADAVEMESEVIGAVCREHKIPFATVRVILDTADEDLPLDFNQFMTGDDRMDFLKLVGAVLKSPRKIGALMKLQKQAQAAAAALSRVLMQVLPQGS